MHISKQISLKSVCECNILKSQQSSQLLLKERKNGKEKVAKQNIFQGYNSRVF